MKKIPPLTKSGRRERRRPTMKVTGASVKKLARILASHRNHSQRGR